jgi:hypothetical protein
LDALELLKQDHKTVKELLRTAKETEDSKKQRQPFGKSGPSWKPMHASKRPFLPGMKKHEELKEMVLASIEEHRQVKTLLREMGRLSSNKGDTEKVEAKLKVLNDNVEHHAEEEEEGKMFPKVRQVIDRAELERWEKNLEEVKHKGSRKAS